MANITISIPDNKVQLVLDAFASARGIPATAVAVKAEFVAEIKQVVKQYKLQRLSSGQEASVAKADLEVDVT